MKTHDLLINFLSIIEPDYEQALFSIEIRVDKDPHPRFKNHAIINKSKSAVIDESQFCALFVNSKPPEIGKKIHVIYSDEEFYSITTTIIVIPIQREEA